MIRAALARSVRKLGVLGAIIVASAVLDMCARLGPEYVAQHQDFNGSYRVTGEIIDYIEYVFPNSLYILLVIVLGSVGVLHILAFFLLIDIPLAYACGLGVEKLRRRYGYIRSVGAYAVASFALYLLFVFLFFRL